MVHMRRLEHNGVHGTKKGAMHPDPVSDDAPSKVSCCGTPKSPMNWVSVSPTWFPSTFGTGYATLNPHLCEYI